jgi:endoglucanase
VRATNAWGTAAATSRATRAIVGTMPGSVPAAGDPSGGPPSTPTPPNPAAPIPPALSVGLHVSGDELVNDAGDVIHLRGVNQAGPAIECMNNEGIFDGGGDAASVAAMASWDVNIVRIALNEDCWLGINDSGINPAYVGQNYINAIVNYVNLLHQYNIYAELSLIFAAPGSEQATSQPGAPDEDHAPAMWSSLASAFRNDPNVILSPWGETTVGWSCFLNGCGNQATTTQGPQDGDGTCGSNCYYYTAAGTQQAVNVMRDAGFHGPIAISCIHYANDCADDDGSWLQYMPSDPDNQLIAEAHVYGQNPCETTACFDSTMEPILQAGHPLFWAETGESVSTSDCADTNIQTFMDWADANSVGYAAWTWGTWAECQALISNYDGTPANDAYATWVYDHYTGSG